MIKSVISGKTPDQVNAEIKRFSSEMRAIISMHAFQCYAANQKITAITKEQVLKAIDRLTQDQRHEFLMIENLAQVAFYEGYEYHKRLQGGS